MKKNTGFIKKLLLNMKKNNVEIQEQDMFIKVLACGIWADGVVKVEELLEVNKIIDSASVENKEVIKDLVTQKIEEYVKENWIYLQDRDDVLSFILSKREWHYAEYLVQIFQADNIITEEEGEITKHLSNLLESKKYFENKLGILL